MINYTDPSWGDIVRGSRWPPAGDDFTIEISNTGGWPDGAEGWTWQVVLSRNEFGGTPDLILNADASLNDTVMSLTFHAEPDETAGLPGHRRVQYRVAVRSIDGSGVISYYDVLRGYAWVRDAVGEP